MKGIKDPLTIIVILLVIAVVLYIYMSMNSYKVQPYEEGFNGSAATDGDLYFVYATWCPHCKTILPEIKNLAAKSPIDVAGKKVGVVMVESEEKEKIAALPIKVEGFPTFFFKKADGTVSEYHGERNVDGLMEFIKSHL
jgi:thiol-disulfide isomerase/thioredoxin